MGENIIDCIRRRGSVQEVRNILECGNVDVNNGYGSGGTALHFCCLYSERASLLNDGVSIIKLLVQNGANVNARGTHAQRTPLMLCMINGCRPELIVALLDSDADPNCVDCFGNVALYYYMCNYYKKDEMNLYIFKRLIPSHMINTNICDDRTPLIACISEGCRKEFIEALLHAGADPKKCISQENLFDSYISGYQAAGCVHSLDVLKLLIKCGGDVNCVNRQGLTPLLLFLESRYWSLDHIMMLLENGANPHLTDGEGNGVLHNGAMAFSTELCQTFLDYHVSPNVKNIHGETPLMIATAYCLRKGGDVIKTLINYGAKIDVDCIMLTRDEVTKKIVQLPCDTIILHYLSNNCTYLDTRYETILKYVFLTHPSIFYRVLDSRHMKRCKLERFVHCMQGELRNFEFYITKSGLPFSQFLFETDRKKYMWYCQNGFDVDVALEENFPHFSGIVRSKIEIARRGWFGYR